MTLCSLIHHMGDVLVDIRASCLDRVTKLTNVTWSQFVMQGTKTGKERDTLPSCHASVVLFVLLTTKILMIQS